MNAVNPRLKTLEALAHEAAARLKALSDENRRLRLGTAHLQQENGELEMKLKRLGSLSLRHDRIRNKLERIVNKLEKVG